MKESLQVFTTEREKQNLLDKWKHEHQTEIAKRDQEEKDAKEDRERQNQQAYKKARIDETFYQSLLY